MTQRDENVILVMTSFSYHAQGGGRGATLPPMPRLDSATCFQGDDWVEEGDAAHGPRDADWFEVFFSDSGDLKVMAWCWECYEARQQDLVRTYQRFGEHEEAEFLRRKPECAETPPGVPKPPGGE